VIPASSPHFASISGSDTFFTGGQDWGFPPLHPERIRREGFRYFAACLRHSMRHAALLRVDHVMALQRLFWVPHGFPASEGVYVRYPAEELYAVLCRESRRSRCAVVGEDLGTVPAETRSALRRHRVLRMFVVQYELGADPRRPTRPVPSDCVAMLNTHDMPPFEAFWRGAAARPLGRALLRFLRAAHVIPVNAGIPRGAEMAGALLQRLARSRCALVLVNPEDHWGELEPQNVPGTGPPRANWTRKARYRLEEIFEKWTEWRRAARR